MSTLYLEYLSGEIRHTQIYTVITISEAELVVLVDTEIQLPSRREHFPLVGVKRWWTE